MHKRKGIYFFSLLPFGILFALLGFWEPAPGFTPNPKSFYAPPPIKLTLSAYGFFEGNLSDLQPAERVIPYSLNTPLFSDYALKSRFAYIPEGATVTYDDKEVLHFPEGTVLIKSFYYPEDFREPEGKRRIMETRLLVRNARGWKALPYVWDEAQTEAKLEVAGGRTPVSWTHTDGKTKSFEYSVPNANQCKGCHKYGEGTQPIGPTSRQLNGIFDYTEGPQNQLEHWAQLGILTGLPDQESRPYAPVWNDPSTGTLDARARIWLDINCAHCHRTDGPANTSGLFLDIHQTELSALGLNKPPTAAGRGSGGRQYGLVPGKANESILVYRMESTDPGEMMPEIGRKMLDEEGVDLIIEWINSMKP